METRPRSIVDISDIALLPRDLELSGVCVCPSFTVGETDRRFVDSSSSFVHGQACRTVRRFGTQMERDCKYTCAVVQRAQQ
ncbi:hypothetical protein X777_07751 [Ooceraea biroi]|uniref:Uncharacterized protein n=1 Tax=Ooceraea biroi TaxID=2015173 RepID=A0A026WZZ4_OOCBI|nr:hypothetical protein X777_07751 [Ooceraea biroi]